MTFILDNVNCHFVDHTHLVGYTDAKPPMRVVNVAGQAIVLPRGVCVVHTGEVVTISCRALKKFFMDVKQRTYRVSPSNVIERYIQVMKDLSECAAYVNADHAKLIHTQKQRLSKSTKAYMDLGIDPIRGVVIFQANGSYFVSVEVNGKNINQRIGLIDDPDIHHKSIRKIYSCILLRGTAWIEKSISAQAFLKKYIMT